MLTKHMTALVFYIILFKHSVLFTPGASCFVWKLLEVVDELSLLGLVSADESTGNQKEVSGKSTW